MDGYTKTFGMDMELDDLDMDAIVDEYVGANIDHIVDEYWRMGPPDDEYMQEVRDTWL